MSLHLHFLPEEQKITKSSLKGETSNPLHYPTTYKKGLKFYAVYIFSVKIITSIRILYSCF